jgi:hypothetical protein
MARAEQKRFAAPDEVREFPNGRAEILRMGGGEVGRFTFAPGWRWSKDVQPIARTKSCEAPHFQFHVAGRLAILMDDGTEIVAEPGDVTALPMGHDAWVVGPDPAVVVDWCGASNYARPGAEHPPEKKAEKKKKKKDGKKDKKSKKERKKDKKKKGKKGKKGKR